MNPSQNELDKAIEPLDESVVLNRAAAIYYLHPIYEGNPFGTRTIVPWEKLHGKGMYLQIARFHLSAIQTALATERVLAAKRSKELEKENTTMIQTLCFFASVIKSGEPWTGTCQLRLDEALNIKESSNER